MEPLDFVPELDQLAGDWLDVDDIAHLPSLHNFHQMAVCAPDLLGIHFWTRESQMFVREGLRFTEYRSYPRLALLVDGIAADTTVCRWFPYQAVRRTVQRGWEVTTTARLVFEESGLLYEIRVRNDAGTRRRLGLVVRAPGASAPGSPTPTVVLDDPVQDLLVTAAATPPDMIEQRGEIVALGWSPMVEPGGEVVIRLVQAEGAHAEEVRQRARRWAVRFAAVWRATREGWRTRWRGMFTPGDDHFSGNAPILETGDSAVARLYYVSLLTLLVLHRTDLALCDRVFVTSGERDRGDVFFWDTSMFSRLFALLEPRGMREQLRLFLGVDPHGGAVFNLDTKAFRGGQYLPGYARGNWYAANDMSLFRLVHDYVAVTNDVGFLDERIGDRAVADHLGGLATAWRALLTRENGLADYGTIDNLLECVPTYTHEVASLNAANVWMMRALAGWLDRTERPIEADALRTDADSLATRVLDRYVAGEGVWVAVDRDGSRRTVRHCYDFISTAAFMADRLDGDTSREMLAFVERELLSDTWMRAMSLADPAAELSDRPDHGPYGAFGAWPAMAAEAMLLLDAPDTALDLLHRVVAATREGPFGQAYELYGPERRTPHAPIRIAQRGACLREGSGGGAFAETVLAGLFGFRPSLAGSADPCTDLGATGFEGVLHHVRFAGTLRRIVRSPDGLRIQPE
ncbi:MAG: hypothetical protein R2726_22935 [Acidimicrobiales bacterium]